MSVPDPFALKFEADQLRSLAKDHKQKAKYHRRKLRAVNKRLSKLREICAKHGITFIFGEEQESLDHGRESSLNRQQR